MLADLEEIIGRAPGNAQDGLERDIRAAARALLERQFIFADDHQGQRRWETVRRHRTLFADLFDVLGYDLFVDEREQSAGIVSQAGAAIRRMSINETLFLVGLRVIYEQRLREFSLKEGGRCEASLGEVWTLIEERTGRTRPSHARCRQLVDALKRNGLVREAGDLPDGDLGLEIRPVIVRAVSEATVDSLDRYLAGVPAGGLEPGMVPAGHQPAGAAPRGIGPDAGDADGDGADEGDARPELPEPGPGMEDGE